MAKRTQTYRLGFPKKYIEKSQGKSDSKLTEKQASNLLEQGKKAAKSGEKLPDEYFKKRSMKGGGKMRGYNMSKGGKVSAKPISSSVKKTLQGKAKSSGISYSTLVKVYRRGQGAWVSSGSRRGVPMAAWSMGRVNSYIKGSKKHDTDLR